LSFHLPRVFLEVKLHVHVNTGTDFTLPSTGGGMVGGGMVNGINLSGMFFSTRDRDNDAHRSYNCADGFGGGWWFRMCTHTFIQNPDFVAWRPTIQRKTKVKEAVMMIKPR
jgi:hypothetical protein